MSSFYFVVKEVKCFLVALLALIPLTYGQPNMMGLAQPDPMKTCVSVRLPWQPEPMYFCIEKEKFKYRSLCMGQQMMTNNCGMNMRDDTLLVSTPWDCCPMVSTPDHCMNAWCPPKPMNRECRLLDMDNSIYGDCCQKYFCEENANPQDCHLKQVQPECHTPPKDKMNCVGFHDMYGCCTKYQCQGEGRPGMCPMEAQMKHFNDRMANGTGPMMSMPMNGAPMVRSGSDHHTAPTSTLYPRVVAPPKILTRTQQPPNQASMSMFTREVMYSYGTPQMKTIPCISDNNCPGAQKCCSSDMSVYANGAYMMKNHHPTYGYCTEPVMM